MTVPFLRIGGMQLFHLEGDDPYDKFLPKISSVISKIVLIYIALTLILLVLYYLNGMSSIKKEKMYKKRYANLTKAQLEDKRERDRKYRESLRNN